VDRVRAGALARVDDPVDVAAVAALAWHSHARAVKLCSCPPTQTVCAVWRTTNRYTGARGTDCGAHDNVARCRPPPASTTSPTPL
jgi:hypothetical protein